MRRTLKLFLCLTCAVLVTAEAGADQHSFDEVGLLYSSQVQFGPDGIPQVTIGLMEEQQSVEVSSPDGLELSGRMEVEGQLVDKVIHTRPGARWRLEVAGTGDAAEARVSYWCGVESLPFARKDALGEAVGLWRGREESVQVFEVGSVFGIQGHVIDNRTYILGIRAFETEEQAESFAQEVFTRYGSRTFVHVHLDRRPSGGITLTDPSGAVVETVLDLVRVRSRGRSPVTVHRVEYARGYSRHGFEDRRYAGTVLVTLDRTGGLVVVHRVAVDRLLEGLISAEIFPSAPMEALKAQAVVARGAVFAKIGTRHFVDPYLLCAATHCQVYSGMQAERRRTSRAVQATRGELLFLGPDLVDSVYSACCGGHTEDNDAVWSHPPSRALRGKTDMPAAGRRRWHDVRDRLDEWLAAEPAAFCRISSFARKDLFRWKRTIDSAEMDRLVAEVKPIGHVVSIQVLGRGVSGRVKVVRVVGTEGDLVVQREWPVRQMFGLIKSGMFTVESITDEEQMVTGFEFSGGGWGHGVGLCQIGATGMAEQGRDYRQILAHYYGGARVYRLYGPQAQRAEENRLRFMSIPARDGAP